jgi:hypothetical protein
MAEIPNQPTGGVPPKPSEASKIQPKKETVRISLPPKPAAKETVRLNLPPKPASVPGTKLGPNVPTINLVVPQVTEVDTSVKIPNAAEVMTHAAPAAQPAPAAKTGSAAPAAVAATAPPVATGAKKVVPAKAAVAAVPGSGAKIGKVDLALALIAAVVAIAGLVDLFLQT